MEKTTGNEGLEQTLNIQLVDSLVQVILSLPIAERSLLTQRLITQAPSASEERVNMRKGKVLSKEIAGNAKKYEAYREAWSRIKSAQENHFFLEAITIQESIISDRLISFFSHPPALELFPEKKNGQFPSLNKLIQHWRSKFPDALELIKAVDQWRRTRNEAIHAIVKSKPEEPTQSIDSFLQKAKEAAEEGERLTKEVCKWYGKEKRKKKKSLS